MLAAALKDAKRVKTVEPQLEALRAEHAGLQVELASQKAEYVRLEGEARERERELQRAVEEGRVDPRNEEEDDLGGAGSPHPGRGGEEHAKLLFKAQKAERRAAALEEEMQEMARANGREVAALKMKLAEAEARAQGGFGSAANLVLGELTPPGTVAGPPSVDVADPLGSSLPPRVHPPLGPPPGSSRRATPPGNKLGPLGGSGRIEVAAAS